MDIAVRLKEEVDKHNEYVEERDRLNAEAQKFTQEAQRVEVERQACFGRVQILKEIADEGVDAQGDDPDEPASSEAPSPE